MRFRGTHGNPQLGGNLIQPGAGQFRVQHGVETARPLDAEKGGYGVGIFFQKYADARKRTSG